VAARDTPEVINDDGTVYKRSNLLPSVVGELNFKKGYLPTAESPTIDAGMSLNDPFVERMIEDNATRAYFKRVLRVDLPGKRRDGKIDVGAIEYE